MKTLEMKEIIDNSKYTSQKEAIFHMLLGNNVFLTGPAGSGKSHVIRTYCDYIRKYAPKKRIFRTSTTGLSALNIHGETLASYSGIGISKKTYQELKMDKNKNIGLWFQSGKKIKATDILIIDEISMCSEQQLTFLRDRLMDILGPRFYRIQIIVAGDFSQLPPVATKADKDYFGDSIGNYCYGTEAWKDFHFVDCFLDRIYRTSDVKLQKMLYYITMGHGNDDFVDESLHSLKVVEKPKENIPLLLSTNSAVNKVNNDSQKKNKNLMLVSDTYYPPKTNLKIAKKFAKERNAEVALKVKIGDTVMITSNDTDSNEGFGYAINAGPGLKNGMIGTIKDVIKESGNSVKTDKKKYEMTVNDMIIFEYEDNGNTYTYSIKRKRETIMDQNDKVIAEFSQFPIKLAYAISIHKSQGQTFSRIGVDLSSTWAPGLGYVALSRATSMKSIILLNPKGYDRPWNNMALKIEPISIKIKSETMKNAKENRIVSKKYYNSVLDNIQDVLEHPQRKIYKDARKDILENISKRK